MRRSFVKRVSDILRCSLCNEVFTNPKRLFCGHTFCADCILREHTKTIRCPTCNDNRDLLRILQDDLIAAGVVAELEVYCQFAPCSWKGTLDAYSYHYRQPHLIHQHRESSTDKYFADIISFEKSLSDMGEQRMSIEQIEIEDIGDYSLPQPVNPNIQTDVIFQTNAHDAQISANTPIDSLYQDDSLTNNNKYHQQEPQTIQCQRRSRRLEESSKMITQDAKAIPQIESRKRGRPKKIQQESEPLESEHMSEKLFIEQPEKRKRGRPRKFPIIIPEEPIIVKRMQNIF